MTAAMTDSSIATLERAFLYLFGRCDGARTEDKAGFNRWDAEWARSAEPRIASGRGFSNVESAHRILTKYRKQLDLGGITLPPIESIQQERAERQAPITLNTAAAAPTGVTIELFNKNMVRVRFPYDADRVARIKSVQGPKKFDPVTKSWELPLRMLDDILKAMPEATLLGSLGEAAANARADAQAASNRLRATIDQNIAQFSATKPSWLYTYQVEGITWLIERRCAILADDMGLGKTVQALLAAKAVGHRIVVVAPAGLRDNWIREATKVHARVEVYSWAKVPPALTGTYSLIADEAHYAQNMKAQRTKNLLAIAEKAECVYLLTGTPIKNGRPANLYPLLVAIRHRLAANRKHYEVRYCNAGPTRWSQWDVTGAAFLEELHAETADSILRRMKTEVLGLPPKTRVWRDAELSAESMALYQQEFARLQQIYRAGKAQKVADIKAALQAETDREERDRLVSKLDNIDSADALVLLGQLNHAGALGKVETAVEMANAIIEEGGQVVVFSRFLDVVESVEAGIEAGIGEDPMSTARVGRITGAEDSTQRQRAIDMFQAGTLKAMVCSYAGGVGVTLTAAQTVILIDRPWTPGDTVQLEDRIYRIGQTKPTFAYWLQHGEFDHWLDEEVLQGKQERAETVMTGQAKALEVVRHRRSAIEFAKEVFG